VHLNNIISPNYLEMARMPPICGIVEDFQLSSFDSMKIKIQESVFSGSGT
jgi:hypothetical protein